MAVATKTKKIKTREIVPPADIRENTRARRAWLADELARVNSDPLLEGKIVGNGSYQVVSVYRVTQIEGRLRHRGHCQFCGNAQVVTEAGLVLHGYSRPGIGYIFNECPGVGQQPLEVSQVITEAALDECAKNLVKITAKLEEAKALAATTRDNLYGGEGYESREPEAWTEQPRGLPRHATADEKEAFEASVAAWADRFPLTNRYEAANARAARLESSRWQTKQQLDHFATLLGWNLLGKPLIEEVVA